MLPLLHDGPRLTGAPKALFYPKLLARSLTLTMAGTRHVIVMTRYCTLLMNRSYSSCGPIHTHTISFPSRIPTAR